MRLAVLFLVHGGENAIEAVRIRALSAALPAGSYQILYRAPAEKRAALRHWFAAIRRLRPALVYVLNTAMPGAVLLPLLRRLQGTRYVVDTGDAVFEMARSSGVNAGHKLALLWLFEKLALKNAAAVVVRGSEHARLLQGQGIADVVVIPDGYAPQAAVKPADVQALRQSLGYSATDFVVGVMGSLVHSPTLDICYGWDLIRALKLLPDARIKGLVIGDGDGLEWLKNLAVEQGVAARLLFTGRIPYAQVPLYLRLMDVALSTQTNNIAGRVRTTGKLPEYLAAGCFVIASRVGEAARVLPEPMLLDYAGAVDAHYPVRLAERIRAVADDPALLALRAQMPALAAAQFSYAESGRKLAAMVERLNAAAGP